MIKEGYICLTDLELKNLKKGNVFVILTEKQAKDHKRFYENGYNSHQNILKIRIELTASPQKTDVKK